MKKGLCNKLLTVLCALVLCMSIVPVTSFAEGTAVDVTTAEQLKEALSDGKTANVTAQIEINEDMALENGNITLSEKIQLSLRQMLRLTISTLLRIMTQDMRL